MTKQEAEALNKAVLPAELQQAEKPTPLGMEFKTGGVVTLSRDAFYTISNVIRPFQYLAAILETAQNQAVATGNILPFYEKDVESVNKNEQGQLLGYNLKPGWDGVLPEKKDNSVSLVGIDGQELTSKKN